MCYRLINKLKWTHPGSMEYLYIFNLGILLYQMESVPCCSYQAPLLHSKAHYLNHYVSGCKLSQAIWKKTEPDVPLKWSLVVHPVQNPSLMLKIDRFLFYLHLVGKNRRRQNYNWSLNLQLHVQNATTVSSQF